LTLGRLLTGALAGVALVVALLLAVLLDGWRSSLLAAAGQLRDEAATRGEALVAGSLRGAEAAASDIEDQIRGGILDPARPRALEAALFARLAANAELDEATFTRPDSAGGGQVSVFRSGGAQGVLSTRETRRDGAGFVSFVRTRQEDASFVEEATFVREGGAAADPTTHPTFAATLAHRQFSLDALWTDLHYAESDAALPASDRRVVVTVMKAVTSETAGLLGVVRVGLLAEHLDAVARVRVEADNPADPHVVFLADAEGRLITRLRPGHPLEEHGGELRASAAMAPEEVRVALASPALRSVGAGRPRQSARVDVAGRPYLLSALALAGTQGWRVGVLVPEDHYLGPLEVTRHRLMSLSAFAFAALLALGVWSWRSVQGGLDRIVQSAARMRDFDFAAAGTASAFRDVGAVLEDLEQAKTALRAMGKYVPVGLVRQLYRARREPVLGGELRDLSVMFTDIRDFTTHSERLAPDLLAAALGGYLQAMTAAIHGHGGTVDKYIGDAVMALWNAPEPTPDHAALACAAALACRDATEALFASPEWEGLPAFSTRFGLHRDDVTVGHFGAPDRLSYTALGDGVNLAARLEGLNKVYGTQILVSDAMRRSAGERFAFRLVDLVAVKGKSAGVAVYELLGTAGSSRIDPDRVTAYERAFEAYRQRRFEAALALLEPLREDGPSRVLAARCLRLLADPPPRDWDGTHVALEK
jgi:adenylate cyclase